MAATASSASMAISAMPSRAASPKADCKPARRVSLGRKMKNFTGMKPESRVSRLGLHETSEEHFARAVLAHAKSSAGSRGGGALSSSCDLGAEIFRVIPIMSGLVLVGIALGFVLLRVEAALEESE